MGDQPPQHSTEPDHHGRHELPPDAPPPEIGELHADGVAGVVRRGRSQIIFGALAVLLCVLLGIAIVTQVRQTESGDSLETARPADLLILLDSLQQREAALNTEVADLQRTLAQLQASGTSDQTAIENAQARLAALSILIGTVPATGPGVTLTITDTTPGVPAETMLDVINELRNAGAEAMELRGGGSAVRVGVEHLGRRHSRRAGRRQRDPEPAVFGSGHWRSADTGGGHEHSRWRDGQCRARRRHDGGAAVRPGGRHRLAATETSPIRSASQMRCAQSAKSRSAVSEIPADLYYTEEHEWVQRTGDDTIRVGITDYAQSALGDVVFVQLPDVGTEVTAGESFGEVESTKSVSDLYAPVSAKVVAVNDDLEGKPAARQLRTLRRRLAARPAGRGRFAGGGAARTARCRRLPHQGDRMTCC